MAEQSENPKVEDDEAAASALDLIPDRLRLSARRIIHTLKKKAPDLHWDRSGNLSFKGEDLPYDLFQLVNAAALPFGPKELDPTILKIFELFPPNLIRNHKLRELLIAATAEKKRSPPNHGTNWQIFPNHHLC